MRAPIVAGALAMLLLLLSVVVGKRQRIRLAVVFLLLSLIVLGALVGLVVTTPSA